METELFWFVCDQNLCSYYFGFNWFKVPPFIAPYYEKKSYITFYQSLLAAPDIDEAIGLARTYDIYDEVKLRNYGIFCVGV